MSHARNYASSVNLNIGRGALGRWGPRELYAHNRVRARSCTIVCSAGSCRADIRAPLAPFVRAGLRRQSIARDSQQHLAQRRRRQHFNLIWVAVMQHIANVARASANADNNTNSAADKSLAVRPQPTAGEPQCQWTICVLWPPQPSQVEAILLLSTIGFRDLLH